MATAVTIGVDLAAQRAETAACAIQWSHGRAEVTRLSCGLDDVELLALVEEFAPVKVAIDAPFGWPRAFVAAVAAYETSGNWPVDDVSPLRLRDTDRAVIVETRQQPLSVSSDRIAVTAMRCARFLTRLRTAGLPVRRDGDGFAVEVYPAAALRIWGLDPRGYKGNKPEARTKRGELVDGVLAACGAWLSVSSDHRDLLLTSDHNLDAVICAILARVVACQLALPIPPEHREAALLEGWIHLPLPDALRRLASADAA